MLTNLLDKELDSSPVWHKALSEHAHKTCDRLDAATGTCLPVSQHRNVMVVKAPAGGAGAKGLPWPAGEQTDLAGWLECYQQAGKSEMQVCALGHLLLALQICCLCCSNPGRDVLSVLVSLPGTSAGTGVVLQPMFVSTGCDCLLGDSGCTCTGQRPKLQRICLACRCCHSGWCSNLSCLMPAGMQGRGTALRHTQQT